MSHMTRPHEIETILKAIGTTENDAGIAGELDVYMAELEAKQPERPDRVETILQEIDQRLPESSTALRKYITRLEAHQQVIAASPAVRAELPVNLPVPRSQADGLPIWSHQRSMRRRKHRQERAGAKLRHQ